jgi:PAS domain S-box-containing protein
MSSNKLMSGLELQARLRSVSARLGMLLCFIGIFTILGWQYNITHLRTPIRSLSPMNPLSALCFLYEGIAIMLLSRKEISATQILIARILSSIILISGILKLLYSLFGINPGIDYILFPEDMIRVPESSMSDSSAYCFILSGISMLLIDMEFRKVLISQYLTLISGFVGFLALLGYIYQVPGFYSILSKGPMSWQASICFMTGAMAILLTRPDKGLMTKYSNRLAGSVLAQWMIPVAILIPTVLGFLRLLGYKMGLYSNEFGTAVLIFCLVVLFVISVAYTSALLNKRDLKNIEDEEEIRQLNETLEERVRTRTESLRQSELRLKEQDEQLRLFVDHSPAALAMFDMEMRYIMTSKSWLRDYNIQAQDIIGKSHYEIFPSISKRWRDIHKRCLNGASEKSDFDFFEASDGSMVYTRWDIRPWYTITGETGGIMMFSQVITDMVEAEMRFKNLVEKNVAGVYILEDEHLTYANPRLADMLGFERDELLHTSLYDIIAAEDHHIFRDYLIRRSDGNEDSLHYIARAYKKNGEMIWVELYVNATLVKGKTANIGTVFEVTEREKATADLVQRNRDLEQFAYIVSHNVRAPLAKILGVSNLLKMGVKGEDRELSLQFMHDSASNLDSVLRDLNAVLQIRRETSSKRSQVKLTDLLESTRSSLGNMIAESKAGIESDFSKADEICTVQGYMQNIFNSLVSNSIKFSRPQEPPRIRIWTERSGKEYRICFEDEGIGFDMERTGDQLFGLYKKFHKNIEGKGLGLFMVKTQVEVLGGNIEVSSDPGKGSKFVLKFSD